MPLPFLAHLRGRLDECILLTYRTPAEAIRPLLPPGGGLEPITHHARGTEWAFWNVALCSIEALRPFPTPHALGMSCQFVAYRLLVKGAEQTGVYFCRTDLDHSLIARTAALSGELAAVPRPCQIFISTPGRRVQFIVRTIDRLGDAEVVVAPPPSPDDDEQDRRDVAKVTYPHLQLVRAEEERSSPPPIMQPGQCDDHNVCIPAADKSIFTSIEQARHVLGTPPLAFGHMGSPSAAARAAKPAKSAKFKLVETVRDQAAWDERPIVIHSARFGYLASLGQTDLSLELAVRVRPIDCAWRLGKVAKVG